MPEEAEVRQVGDNLKVDVEKMRQHAKDIGSALQEFNNFGETPFEDELELLAGMNADFTAQFRTMLSNLNKGNQKLSKLLEGVESITGDIAENFAEIDQKAAQQTKGKGG